MNIRHNEFGYIVISDVINGQLIERRYTGWTVTQAKTMFRNYVRQLSRQ